MLEEEPDGPPPEEEYPSELNTRNYGNFLEVNPDKLGVRYYGQGAHGNDVGAIQANRPVPSNTLVYYFELDVKDAGERGSISIGFSDKDFKLSRQPGWEPNSYGYHGDDGHKFHENGTGEEYGPPFSTGDTVGAGIHLGRQEIFFTKNGKSLGVAFKTGMVQLIPTIGFHSRDEQAVVNFGGRPFVYDLEAMVAEEKDTLASTLGEVDVQAGVVHKVVRSYLLHYGYADTLGASSGGVSQKPGRAELSGEYELGARKELRRRVLEGDVDGAAARLREQFPDLLDEAGDLHFHLSCQKFVELIWQRRVEEAAAYAREELSKLRGRGAVHDSHLERVVALIAYEEPEDSPVQRLVTVRQREAVADEINAAVLRQVSGGGGGGEGDAGAGAGGGGGGVQGGGWGGGSIMETLLRQLVLVQRETRDCNGGLGEQFSLEQHV